MTDPDQIAQALQQRGPLTGAQLHEAVGGELFGLWKACRGSDRFVLRVVGRRYVRMDRDVEEFARLSPSILREFLTYSVVGLEHQQEALTGAAERLQRRIVAISRNKWRVAKRFTDEIVEVVTARGLDASQFCVLIAGDVVHDMAHDVPRRESSTGGLVDGSDLDLVVLVGDDVPQELLDELDRVIVQRKWLYLRNSMVREEVDYVVKPLSRLAEQAGFDTFQHQVACKVFNEARHLAGSHELHEAGRLLLIERGVVDKLRELEARAAQRRVVRQEWLLSLPGDELPTEGHRQFFNDDEAAEFEHR